MSEALLRAEGVRKSFRMGHGELHVLRGCSLHVQAGEFVAIMGKSGSGKSTLLHILGALDTPDAGSVQLLAEPDARARGLLERLATVAFRVMPALRPILIVLLILGVIVWIAHFLLLPFYLWTFRDQSLAWMIMLAGSLIGGFILVSLLLLIGKAVGGAVEQRKVELGTVAKSGTQSADFLASFVGPVERFLQQVQGIVRVILLVIVGACAVLILGLPVAFLVLRAAAEQHPQLLRYHLLAVSVALAALVYFGFVQVVVLATSRLILIDTINRAQTWLRRQSTGFVFQFYHLLPELNVLENVLLARMMGSSALRWLFRRGAARRRALDIVKRVGLAERLKHRPNELSGGERQRVAIARALVHKPKILFADEPTGNLDAEAGAQLMALLKELHQEGQTIVMVTHDPGIAARADRVLRLEDGKLRAVQLDRPASRRRVPEP